jgi:hypothetical protein
VHLRERERAECEHDGDLAKLGGDALKHVTAPAAMDMTAAGVVVVTPMLLVNPYALDEVRVFTDHDALKLILIDETGRLWWRWQMTGL